MRCALLLLVCSCARAARATTAGLEIIDLSVEHLTDDSAQALAIDVPAPRFSWVVSNPTASARGVVQQSYRLRVWRAPTSGTETDWDSGEIRSNMSTLIPFGVGGNVTAPLQSDCSYIWEVSIAMEDGSRAAHTARFETGLLSPSDWQGARWIAPHQNLLEVPERNTLRREFNVTLMTEDVGAPLGSVFVASAGYHVLYLNGKPLGDTSVRLAPGNSHFERRLYYVKYILYACNDSTAGEQLGCLRQGRNVFGVELGHAWFSKGATTTASPKGTGMPGARSAPMQFMLRARISTSGRKARSSGAIFVVSEASSSKWLAAAGAITRDSLYNGETRDFRRASALVAPSNAHFSDALARPRDGEWNPAAPASAIPPSALLKAQMFEPIRQLRRLLPVSITPFISRGSSVLGNHTVYTIDFGQNSAGVVRLKLDAPGLLLGGTAAGAGLDVANVTILHAEALMHPPYGIKDGSVYRGNLRKAEARDELIIQLANASSAGWWSPTFTQHGFRYVEVHGLARAPNMTGEVEMLEVRSATRTTGTFSCSNNLLNDLQSACAWSASSNLMSMPTDCPQRNERRGWMGDAAVSSGVTSYNMGMAAFYRGFIDLMADDQGNGTMATPTGGLDVDGAMPNWVPMFGDTFPGHGAPNWQTAFPTLVYVLWRHYGDEEIVRRMWPRLERYLAWYERRLRTFPHFADDPFRRDARDGVLESTQFPGDWCPPNEVAGAYWNVTLANASLDPYAKNLGEAQCGQVDPGLNRESDFASRPLSSAFSYLHDRTMVAEMGSSLGLPGNATRGISPEDARNFNSAFLRIENSTGEGSAKYGSGFQTEQILALALDGVVPEQHRSAVLAGLVDDITMTHANHTTCGILGLRFGLDVLAEAGRADVALAMLLRTDYPSYGWALRHPIEPATTVWELFDAPLEGPSMNSRNHVMMASPSAFLFRSVAGIFPRPGAAAWAAWNVAPKAVYSRKTDLQHAEATVRTPRGPLAASWWRVDAMESTGAVVVGNDELVMNVSVPVGLTVFVAVPVPPDAVVSRCTVTESEAASVVWHDGAFLTNKVDGVLAGALLGGAVPAIELELTCGDYALQLKC